MQRALEVHTPDMGEVARVSVHESTERCEMLVEWEMDEGEVHRAERWLGGRYALNIQVESLGEHGWDWHVWERSGHGQQRYGLAESLTGAKGEAEAALDVLVRELGLTA